MYNERRWHRSHTEEFNHSTEQQYIKNISELTRSFNSQVREQYSACQVQCGLTELS